MFRKTEDLKVGDWILVPSLVTSRFCGKPWQVDKIATSRVYISYRPGGDPTDIETKYIQRDRILLVFTTESEANEASDKARLLSDIYESDLRDLKKRHQEKVKAFIDLVSGADPRYAAMNEIQQAYLRKLAPATRELAIDYLAEKAKVYISHQDELNDVPEFAICVAENPEFWIDCCESVEDCKKLVETLGLTLVDKK